MYGAVPLRHIKETLLSFRRAGTLDRVRMVLLTNCTFDGIVYDVERVMLECLAIKPDLVFLWDEAWFAFARCHPIYRQRTGMASAARLAETFKDPAYARRHATFAAGIDWNDDEQLLNARLLPDPARARVRVYATHSTHKTLTALRQGSMIHVWDQDFKDKVEESFHEAYMTHTSTSPNYQILASLDVGRRQVELEGYELIQRQLELAMSLREQVLHHPLLKRYFRFLRVSDMVPAPYRESGVDNYYNDETGWDNLEAAWQTDEFALDPTRATLTIGATGMDGDTFKNKELMDRYGIQINKTSRNTVLFMTNIGSTRSAIAYLIEVLVKIARDVDARVADMSSIERRIHERRVRSLTLEQPPLPDFSSFHFAFRGRSVEGQRRDARRRYPQRLLPVLRGRQLRVHRHGRGRPGHRRRPRAGVGAVRDPLPARLSHPGARPGHQRRDPAVHGRAGCARDPRLPARAGLPHLQPGRAGPGRAGHRRPRGPGAGRTRRPVAGRRPARADRTGACRHGVPAAKKPVSRSKK